MATSAIFILDMKGKILISRDYRGDVPMSVASKFAKKLFEEEAETQLPPVTMVGQNTCVYIEHNNLYLMAVTKQNSNCMLILNYLYRMVDVFKEYFNVLEEESIRDNFVITYELLDEMMDFGYPQSTDGKILKNFIMIQERHKMAALAAPASLLTNAVGWRAEGIVHKKNEVFLDVIESINILIAANGAVLRSEVLGVIRMKTFLTGMPTLKLGLNDKVLFESRGVRGRGKKAVDMEDIRFHQCVKMARFDNDRTISFIPPDGPFDMMSYRVVTKIKPLISIECLVERHSGSRVEYMIKAKSNFKRRFNANNVQIIIPVPADSDSPKFRTSTGKVEYLPDKEAIIWKIPQFQGGRDFLMRAHFGLPSIDGEQPEIKTAPISVKFEMPYFTVSGIQVRYLKIVEKSGYQALPWVRYITQNGDYQIRMR